MLTVFNPPSSTHAVRGDADIFIFVLLGFLPLFSQSVVILNKLHHLLHLLTYVDALIFAVFICTRRPGNRTGIMLWMSLQRAVSLPIINYCSFEQKLMFYLFLLKAKGPKFIYKGQIRSYKYKGESKNNESSSETHR